MKKISLSETIRPRIFKMKTLKIFFSETTRPRALIFGMYHHLVGHYHFVQINSLGPKMSPPRGSHVSHRFDRGKTCKIFLSETIRPRALIFGI